MHLPGTKYWPDLAGKVLFWEHSMEANMQAIPVAKTRAWMADLVNIGTLGLIAGMVVGRPFAHDEAMLREFEKAILDQCEGTDFPILTGVDVGHTSPMLTLPLDALVQLDSGKDEFSVLESVVE
jgi:muramoyltetrapeptide carboxypeptidase LdcA involved in peptidoglycan recycling